MLQDRAGGREGLRKVGVRAMPREISGCPDIVPAPFEKVQAVDAQGLSPLKSTVDIQLFRSFHLLKHVRPAYTFNDIPIHFGGAFKASNGGNGQRASEMVGVASPVVRPKLPRLVATSRNVRGNTRRRQHIFAFSAILPGTE